MRKNHSKIVCIKLVHLPYLDIDCFGGAIQTGLLWVGQMELTD